MTYKANQKLPYDQWFDENPLKDTKYIEKAEYEKCDEDLKNASSYQSRGQ